MKMRIWKSVLASVMLISFPLSSLACGREGEDDDGCGGDSMEEITVYGEASDDFDDWWNDLSEDDWEDESLFDGDTDDTLVDNLENAEDNLVDTECTDRAEALRAQCHSTYEFARYGCVASLGFLARAGILRFVPNEFRTTGYGVGAASIWATCTEVDRQADAWCDAQADQVADSC